MSTATPEEDRYMRSLVETDQAWTNYTKHPTDDTWEYYTMALAEEKAAAIALVAADPKSIVAVKELSTHLFSDDSPFSVPVDTPADKV